MADKVDDLDRDALRIGDLVLFKDVNRGLFLGVEGILLEDLVATDGFNLQDSLFCVHLQRQYSASRDLHAFLENYDMDVKNIEDEGAKKYLKALQRGLENEKKLNDNYMRKKQGQRVNFGDIIQLYHVKSGKYLTIIPDMLAKVERENVHVMLDVNGNAFSWLQIYPRFKIDKEGDRVLSHAEMYLKVAERSNEYLHTADREPGPGSFREVNCAMENNSWRLIRYQSSEDALDPTILLAAQLVTITDPETRSNLTIKREEVESLDDDKILSQNIHLDAGQPPVAAGKPAVKRVKKSGSGGSVEGSGGDEAKDEKEHTGGGGAGGGGDEDDAENDEEMAKTILEPINQDKMDSNHLWFIESGSMFRGGPIKWRSDQVRFKHMNSGMYLYYTTVVTEDEAGETSEEVVFSTTQSPSEPGTLFSANEINSTGKFLSNAKALQIGHNGTWIERGDVVEDALFVFNIKGTKDKANALSLMIHRCVQEKMGADGGGGGEAEDGGGAGGSSSSGAEPMDVFSGLAARYYLRKFHDMTIVPRSDSVNTVWPKGVKSDMAFFQLVVDKTVFFSQGFPISAVDIQLGIDKGDLSLRRVRQNLLREQDTLEVVLRMINKLIPLTDKLDKMKRGNAGPQQQKRKKSVLSEEEQQMVAMGQQILTKCFHLLYYSILDNQENQMYVADFMPILLAHLNAQPLAGKSVTEMLSKNLELQETKIGTREIQIFVDKLRSSKMNAMYLQLLQACCSCEGNGVDGNQCKVANMLFSNTNDIIINLHADYTRVNPVVWEQPSLYIPPAPIAGSPVAGQSLISKGIPALSLAWTTNSIDFSPLGLFGKLSVNVEELFRKKFNDNLDDSKTPGASRKKNKKKSTQDQKDAVANYFIAEMFLGAEMCMDRNYVAMHKLDDLFSYEVLVSIIKLDVSHELKSAAVRLLMCLHVDRDPQATSKIPLLTRTWSEIKKNPEPPLPYVDNGRKHTFGLIQQMISEHVRGMAGTHWDELSRHMLKMLRTMVEFNFYGTNERMNDVIGPLVEALDRRKVILIEREPTQTNLRKKKVKRPSSSVEQEEIKQDTAGVGRPISPAARATTPNQGDNSSRNDMLFGGDAAQKDEEKNDTDNLDLTMEDADEMERESLFTRFGRGCWRFVLNLTNINNAARLIPLIDDDDPDLSKVEGFQSPKRYSKAPIYELETMVEAVDILAFAQRVIEDRNISLLLRNFYNWESGNDRRSPSELFEQVVNDSSQLTLDIADFDNVMIDVMMFVHMPLMQSTLEVLMAHHSMRRTLLDNAMNVQLLASHKRERQFKMVDGMLQQLEQNAETHELWGELETEADHLQNKQTKDILSELTDICRQRRQVLEFDEDYEADREIQDLFRNLGCFDICMKVMGLLDSVEEDEDGELDEVAQNTRDLCLKCNELLYWFFLGNAKNQELGFGELDFFLEALDMEIISHKVIRAIFKNNEALMRIVPHKVLSDMVDLIFKNGRSHYYLSLFSAISHVGEKNIVENQFEIVKNLTSPGRLEKVTCFLVPVDDPAYAEKRELMAELKDRKTDVTLDELPPLLAYHLMFLDVLSGCTVGRLNITTVEAKVQSVFSNVDIVASILDPGTILIAKIIMSKYLFNAVIEVELVIPGLDRALHLWRLLDSYQDVLNTAKDDFLYVQSHGWEGEGVSRQKIEYILVSIMIIGGFFGHYYDSGTFRGTEKKKGAPATPGGKSRYSKADANQLIVTFFHKIKDVYDLESNLISEEIKVMMKDTLDSLKRQGSKYIHVHIAPRPIALKGMSGKGVAIGANGTANTKHGAGGNSSPTKAKKDAELIGAPSPMKQEAQAIESTQDTPSKRLAAKKARDDAEARLIGRYREFLSTLNADSAIQYKADNENVAFISILERLPFIADQVESDVRYETLIRKLVSHIRENIKVVNNQKRLDARVTKTSTWIIRAFRTMIENRMGMSIYERDDEGGQEQDEAAAPVVNALNSCGATALCLDLIAVGIDEGLQLEAIKLGVGLLFKEGGALEVQAFMHNHLSKTQSGLFFKQVSLALQKLQAWHTWNEVIILEEDEEPAPPDELLIVRFLQLMCEGHYLPNQDIMREQPNNPESYNLLDDFVNYLNCLSRIPCRTSTTAGIRLSATILEVIQGPCEGNQLHFALNTELVEALNRLNRAKVINDCVEDEEIELKKTSIDIFQGLLEGQGAKSAVYDRVLSVIHLDIIQMMSKKPLINEKQLQPTEEQEILQTECVVLLQMLCNYKPSLYDELGISRNIEDIVGSGTAMIEVIWRGDIHRRFFHVPSICDYLAKSSKDILVENVDRSNSENKLIDFLDRSHDLYREVKHQQLLTEVGVSNMFSRQNQNYATWITFVLAFLINALFIMDYTRDDGGGGVSISDNFNTITLFINVLQAVVSSFTLILWLVVKSPVTYQSFSQKGFGVVETILLTASEPLTVYYVIYLVISILGVVLENYYCSLLLLDIIAKNSITRDVLMAMVTPWKQLLMALLLEGFVIYIFSFYIFYFFRFDVDDGWCDTLYDCLKFTLSYGLQNGGGIGDAFQHSVGQRLLLDLTFYCVVIVILLNVIFGIIIDTFSSLRVDKLERQRDTLEVCFICGINKQVFDRASDEPEGFKTHIKVDHNMWNYLYFIFMLWEQDKDDDDGLEQYVRRAIDANEIIWFPLRKAMRLEQVASSSDVLRTDLKEGVRITEGILSEKFDEFQLDVNIMMEQLITSLKNEPMVNPLAELGSPGMESAFERMHQPSANEDGVGETSTHIEEEEDAFDDATMGSENSYTKNIQLGRHISIGIAGLEGVELDEFELRTISCRIIFMNVVNVIKNSGFSQGEVLFDENKVLPLFDNVQPMDRRMFQVQILHGLGQPKFLAQLEMSVLELASPDGEVEFIINKQFLRPEQANTCTLKLMIINEEAKAFGRSPSMRKGSIRTSGGSLRNNVSPKNADSVSPLHRATSVPGPGAASSKSLNEAGSVPMAVKRQASFH